MLPWMFGKKCSGNSEQAIVEAGLDFTVEKMPLFVHEPQNHVEDSNNFKFDYQIYQIPECAIYRRDTHTRLGVVGKVYQPLQNTEAFKFMDSLIESFQVKYEYAGQINGGAQVWMIASIPSADFDVKGQPHKAYVTFFNGHDGKTAIRCYPLDVRHHNVYTLSSGMSVRHTSKSNEQVQEGMRIMQNTLGIFERYGEKLNQLAEIPVDMKQFKQMMERISGNFFKIHSDEFTLTEEDRTNYNSRKLDRKRTSHYETVLDLMRAFQSENNECPIKNTAYNAFNAVNQWANHGQRYNGSTQKKNETRFTHLISGKMRKIQSVALDTIINFF